MDRLTNNKVLGDNRIVIMEEFNQKTKQMDMPYITIRILIKGSITRKNKKINMF